MTYTVFDGNDTCEICTFGELDANSRCEIDGAVVSIVSNGIRNDQAAEAYALSIAEDLAVKSCAAAIRNGTCLKYASNLNPKGGYDG